MGNMCGDNRFEIISKAKEDILKSTNISSSEDEMKVIDNFLFRCWQMGWLDRYNGVQLEDKNPINVWHDASEEPTIEQTHILATNEKDIIEVFPLREGRKYNLNGNLIDWSMIVVYFNLTKWAYIDDLLPKGGE